MDSQNKLQILQTVTDMKMDQVKGMFIKEDHAVPWPTSARSHCSYKDFNQHQHPTSTASSMAKLNVSGIVSWAYVVVDGKFTPVPPVHPKEGI